MHTNEFYDDLANQDDTYEKCEAVEKKAFDDVPSGRYQAFIDKLYLDRAKTSKRLLLKWELVIAVGPYQGRRLFRNNTLETQDNLRWLKTDLLAVGLELGKLSDLPEKLPGLIGVMVDINVAIKGDGDQARTNVYINKRVDRDGATPAAAPTAMPKGGSSHGLSRF
ncbi:MAG: DUF669 domain-containing protein [Armatimonadota bacterium]